MRIAVTGALGFVGSHLVRHFAATGHSVLALGRQLEAPLALKKIADYQAWDITTKPPPAPNIDVLIHAAAQVNFSGNEGRMIQQNVVGTQHVLTFAAKAAHVIVVSSSSVYPTTTTNEIKTESMAGASIPGTPYGRTKLAAEEVARTEAGSRRLTILRPHAIYGPGDRVLLPNLLRHIRRGRLPILGNGRNTFSITHVGNLCRAAESAISHQASNVGVYNVADATPLALIDIFVPLLASLHMNVRILKIPRPFAQSLAAGLRLSLTIFPNASRAAVTADLITRFCHDWAVDLNAAQREIQYQPRYTFQQSLPAIADWAQSIGGVSALRSTVLSDSWHGNIQTY